ncbi:MAG: putative toxin-antitoxin system toxin component, PIN family [Gammaproteobacteria bacterium]|nr:MAG: putative toxin-antitoxin system toxin component, PIN family [Gammaproteobacteria bacterium]
MNEQEKQEIVVIDTNIFISALLSAEGASRLIIRACLEACYQPLMGTTLLAEYEDVMQREALFKNCPIDVIKKNELLDAFLSVCEWTDIYYLWRPNLRDEADNHIIELAVAGNAKYVVTYNIRDFKNAQLLFPNLFIVKPEQLLT